MSRRSSPHAPGRTRTCDPRLRRQSWGVSKRALAIPNSAICGHSCVALTSKLPATTNLMFGDCSDGPFGGRSNLGPDSSIRAARAGWRNVAGQARAGPSAPDA